MEQDKKISIPPVPPPIPPKPTAQQPTSNTQNSTTTPPYSADERPSEPMVAPIISRSTPLAEGLGIKKAPPTPTVPKDHAYQSNNNNINLEEELAPKTIKYSIRTMVQDLERAKKEGGYSKFTAKTPTTPPPPPLRTTAPIEAAKSSIPKTPIVKMAEVSPTLTPPTPIPVAMPPTKIIVTPPPTKKPSQISFAHLNLIIVIISVVIIFIGSTGFSYWWFFVRETPITPITEQPSVNEEQLPPIIEEPALPKTIILTDQDIIIEVTEKSPSKISIDSLLSQISESAKILDNKKLARVLFKYSSETEKRYLSFTESISMLNITIPDSFIGNITDGEILAYSQNNETRYGLATQIIDSVKIIDIMKDWEKTIINDFKNIYIDKIPTNSGVESFKDFSYKNFISRYLSLPTPDISMTWGVSDAEKIFVIVTSKDMMYRVIGYKEEDKPVLRTFSSGTLVRAKGDTKIYRIIDDKKIWVPTVKAFIDSGYPAFSEIEILPEELDQYQNARYIKLKDSADVYEIKDNKKYLVANPQILSPTEIKTSTNAEFIAYPIGQ